MATPKVRKKARKRSTGGRAFGYSATARASKLQLGRASDSQDACARFEGMDAEGSEGQGGLCLATLRGMGF